MPAGWPPGPRRPYKPDADRSHPGEGKSREGSQDGRTVDVKNNKAEYHAQYMRWKRAGGKREEGEEK